MKRIVCVFCFVLSIASYAQSDKFSYGFRAGVSLSSAKGSVSDVYKNFNPEFDGYRNKLGWKAGVFSVYKLTDIDYIQGELLYSNKGFSYGEDLKTSSFEVSNVSTEINLNYIDFVLLWKTELFKKLNLLVGPQVGYLLAANVKNDSFDFDIKDSLEEFDYGLNIGLEYQIGSSFLIDIRYELGLTEISSRSSFLLPGSEIKNKGFILSLGYEL